MLMYVEEVYRFPLLSMILQRERERNKERVRERVNERTIYEMRLEPM